MADDDLLNQSEIEKLLAQQGGKQSQEEKSEKKAQPPAADGDDQAALDQSEIEALLGGKNEEAGSQKGAASHGQPSASEGQAGQATGDEDKLLGQDDIEKLLSQAGRGSTSPPRKDPPPPQAETSAGESDIAQEDLDHLLSQAEAALASINEDQPGEVPPGVVAFQLHEFKGAPPSTEAATLDLLKEVELDVKIELGRTHMYLEDVLKLRNGSVVPLDKLAGDPVDIYVNGRLVARGEVLVLNDNFCVRVAELVAGRSPTEV